MWFGPKTEGVPDPPTEPPEGRRSCGSCRHFSENPGGDEWGVCIEQARADAEAGVDDFIAWTHVDDGFDCDCWEEE